MFERFTLFARRVIVVAENEAKTLHHDLIRPEHLLLGLVQGDGLAARALGELGVSLEPLRAAVEATVERSKSNNRGSKVPFSPKAKKVLELSLREALRLGHNYIGTEHILLGAIQVLDDDNVSRLLDVDANDIGAKVTELMRNGGFSNLPQSPAVADATRRARTHAGSGPMTTGHLLLAILNDTTSQASKVLQTFGVSIESVALRLAEVPLNETSDAPPRPKIVEIKLGETTTTISDPELAAGLGGLSPEQLRIALRKVLGVIPEQPEAGLAQDG